ncbi:hypothetical protein [Ornithinimicrobium kibberense]|uniref:hypothetical protein n=1 Tax=Ornithinimicrobium kibberense TaxID=282060 RepID=UPI00360D2966
MTRPAPKVAARKKAMSVTGTPSGHGAGRVRTILASRPRAVPAGRGGRRRGPAGPSCGAAPGCAGRARRGPAPPAGSCSGPRSSRGRSRP